MTTTTRIGETMASDGVSSGVCRFRQAIENQVSVGEALFTLPMAEAGRLCDECGRDVSDARRELADLKVDLGWWDEQPGHYEGDGVVSAARALRSMARGWEQAPEQPPTTACFWAMSALKYLWRWPLKGHPGEDLAKALDCCQRALDAWEGER